MERRIVAYKGYFAKFVEKLQGAEEVKLMRVLDLLKVEERMPRHFIKHLRDGVYELRVNFGNNELRVLFIFDGDTIVVLLNAFRKKTQKTPNAEIEKALRLKREYYEDKGNT